MSRKQEIESLEVVGFRRDSMSDVMPPCVDIRAKDGSPFTGGCRYVRADLANDADGLRRAIRAMAAAQGRAVPEGRYHALLSDGEGSFTVRIEQGLVRIEEVSRYAGTPEVPTDA